MGLFWFLKKGKARTDTLHIDIFRYEVEFEGRRLLILVSLSFR